MSACPKCGAETPPDAVECLVCQSDLAADEFDEIPTLHTRPKLLVLRNADRPRVRPASRLTDHAIDIPAETPTNPPPPGFRLRVVRGLRVNLEYPLYEGKNMIGRGDDRPVDVDLRDQEPADRIWASRQHASLNLVGGVLTIEDLVSTNGTYVNRHRLPPGATRRLKEDDVLQVGTIQLKVTR
jgi:hypothetical protein